MNLIMVDKLAPSLMSSTSCWIGVDFCGRGGVLCCHGCFRAARAQATLSWRSAVGRPDAPSQLN